ncbi:Response regulator of zinc sigma-54-dependent two-component system [hydrothermal vent metagenome]|uniref:Response regulator of zinc sigma-54-dependent two-component system n=1 Tax=hydrothermal vent metagenome TaxID=652676 RepID=A0A3B0VRY9_9ZZZZ
MGTNKPSMTSSTYALLAYDCSYEHREDFGAALADNTKVTIVGDPRSFQQELNKNHYDVLVINVTADKNDAFDLLEQTHRQNPYTPIIVTSETEKADFIVQAIRRGAYDFIVKPFSPARIQLAVQKAINHRGLRNEIDYLRGRQDIVYDFSMVVAETPAFKTIISSLKKFAETDSTILMTGDTGTGKSFLSGSIHYNSHRRDKPFIKINCANIPETLLESELFGHEKGSFTGAVKQRIGRFEQANGGTIFLDEIGEISLEIQTKLLRVLEEKSFERVGGNKTIQVDIRVIAATNKDLDKQITRGKFREDLFYRINVLPIHLPPLRERPDCIEPLAKVMLQKACTSLKKKISDFSPTAMEIIKAYNWPGNIRQLTNTIERAVILEESNHIQPESIAIPRFHTPAISAAACEPLKVHEKDLILKALNDSLWVQKRAAKRLGISPRSLNYKIKKLGITHPNWRKNR